MVVGAAPVAGDDDFSVVATALESALVTARDALAACDQILRLGEHFSLPKRARTRLLNALEGHRSTTSDKLLLERIVECERALHRATATAGARAPPVAGGARLVATSLCDIDEAGRKLAIVYEAFAQPLPHAGVAAPAVVAATPGPALLQPRAVAAAAAEIPVSAAPAAVAAAPPPSLAWF